MNRFKIPIAIRIDLEYVNDSHLLMLQSINHTQFNPDGYREIG